MVYSRPGIRRHILAWEIAVNLPCIMIQRFNRPRLERLLPEDGSGRRLMKEFWKN